MEGIFAYLINGAIQSTPIIITVFLIRFFKKLPRKAMYFLWALAFLRLLMPFSLETVFSLFPKEQPFIYYKQTDAGEILSENLSFYGSPRLNAPVNSLRICTIIWVVVTLLMLTAGILAFISLKRLIDYMLPNLDFDVWMSLEDNVSSEDIIKQIDDSYTANNVTVRQDLLDSVRYEATLQATSGILTFNFIAIFIILFLGFIIVNILSLKNNTLCFATLRAIGMEEKDITFMLITEHILTGIIPIIFAIILGHVASIMFIPVLSTAFSIESQIPSIRIAFNNNDYLKIYLLILLLYAVITIITIPFIKKLQPANAIKLSEE